MKTKIYDKRDDFDFDIVNRFRALIPQVKREYAPCPRKSSYIYLDRVVL